MGRFGASWVIGALLALSTLSVVVAQASSLISTKDAMILLLSLAVTIAVAVRPAWLVLGIAATPYALTRFVPARGLMLLFLVTLLAHLVMRGRVSVGIRSGMVPLLLLVLAAHFFAADVSGHAALQARGFLNVFTYFVLLGLTAYNSTLTGELKVDHLSTALLVGAVLTVIMERTGLAVSQSAQANMAGVASVGRNISYVGAIGFSLSFARLLLPNPDPARHHRILYGLLAGAFGLVAVLAFVRAAWLSCLIVVILLGMWTRKRWYWLLLAVVAAVVVLTPAARERVLPGYSAGIKEALESSQFSTGRYDLWAAYWDEITPALPEGRGYGYTFDLSPQRLLGTENYGGNTSSFVFPHNDFLFWTMELGLLGLAANIVFWAYLVRAFRWLSRHGSPPSRLSAYVLSGIPVTTFAMQLVDNSFAIPAVTQLFYIAAGAIFGIVSVAKRQALAEGYATHLGTVV